MSRDLAPEEMATFQGLYGTGKACEACGNTDLTVRIWEKYGTTSKEIGGDIGPGGIVAAVALCEACGHGQVVERSRILAAAPAA